jgi:hypothetical protein
VGTLAAVAALLANAGVLAAYIARIERRFTRLEVQLELLLEATRHQRQSAYAPRTDRNG